MNNIFRNIIFTSNNIIDNAILIENLIVSKYNLQDFQNANIQNAKIEKEIAYYRKTFFQRVVLQEYKFSPQNCILEFANDNQILDYIKNNDYENDVDFKSSLAYLYYNNKIKNTSFLKSPNKTDYEHLIKDNDKIERNGFEYYNKISEKDVIYNANYCLYCHGRGKDTCKSGIKDRINELGNILDGCPLEQNISEMIKLYSEGYLIAALIVAMIENPLICLTGDRICNDCIKSCIYQKQDGVDIPKIESFIFEKIINLEYGFEIYYQLCVFHPLRQKDQQKNGSVYISGMGPSGISAALYSRLLGFDVILTDGGYFSVPDINFLEEIRSFPKTDLMQDSCFGGIMRYGITPRWNKGYLLCAYIILARIGVKIQGNIKYTKDLENYLILLGYKNILVANGAKNPRNISNISKKFTINASDFLMNIQLNHSWKENSLYKLNIPQNIVVLGGGLTAIDAATEGLMLIKQKYQTGSVKILMRSKLNKSNAYKINHLEIESAIAQGIEFIDEINIIEYQENEDYIKILTNKGEFKTNLIITAQGLKNEYQESNEIVKYLGDINIKYTGSVVKAIASGKIVSQDLHNSNVLDINNFYTTVKYEALSENIYKILYNAPYLDKIAKVGDLIKLIIVKDNIKSESIPLIICGKNNDGSFFSILKVCGQSTTLIKEKDISLYIMHSSRDEKLEKASCIIYDNNRKESAISLAQNLNIKAIDIGNISIPEENSLFICTEENFAKFKEYSGVLWIIQLEMQCMLSGVCSKCRYYENGIEKYGCKEYIQQKV